MKRQKQEHWQKTVHKTEVLKKGDEGMGINDVRSGLQSSAETSTSESASKEADRNIQGFQNR